MKGIKLPLYLVIDIVVLLLIVGFLLLMFRVPAA